MYYSQTPNFIIYWLSSVSSYAFHASLDIPHLFFCFTNCWFCLAFVRTAAGHNRTFQRGTGLDTHSLRYVRMFLLFFLSDSNFFQHHFVGFIPVVLLFFKLFLSSPPRRWFTARALVLFRHIFELVLLLQVHWRVCNFAIHDLLIRHLSLLFLRCLPFLGMIFTWLLLSLHHILQNCVRQSILAAVGLLLYPLVFAAVGLLLIFLYAAIGVVFQFLRLLLACPSSLFVLLLSCSLETFCP